MAVFDKGRFNERTTQDKVTIPNHRKTEWDKGHAVGYDEGYGDGLKRYISIGHKGEMAN